MNRVFRRPPNDQIPAHLRVRPLPFPFPGASLDLDPVNDRYYRSDLGVASAAAVGVTTTRASQAWYYNAAGILTPAGNNELRRDFDPISGICRGWLIEEQRSNISLNSEDGAGWVAAGVTPPTVSNGISVHGLNACSISFNSSSQAGFTGCRAVRNSETSYRHSITIGNSYAYQCLVSLSRPLTGSERVSVYWTGASGSSEFFIDASSSSRFVGRFSKVTNTLTPVANGTNYPVVYLASPLISGLTVWVTRFQAEVGGASTSYIPTVSGVVSRSGDVVQILGSGFNSFFNQLEGTLITQARQTETLGSVKCHASANDGTTQNRIMLYSGGADASVLISSSGTTQAALSFSGVNANSDAPMAVAYKANNFAFSSSIGAVATDSSGIVPAVSRLEVGYYSGSGWINGHIKRLIYIPKRIPNSWLAQLGRRA